MCWKARAWNDWRKAGNFDCKWNSTTLSSMSAGRCCAKVILLFMEIAWRCFHFVYHPGDALNSGHVPGALSLLFLALSLPQKAPRCTFLTSWCAFLTSRCAFLTSRCAFLTLRFPYIALSLLFPGFMWNGKITMLGHSTCIVEYENVFSFAFW